MASKERQLKRWEIIKQPEYINLKCFICDYENLYNSFKKIIAKDIFGMDEIIRHECPNCNLIFGDLRYINLSEEERQNDHDDTYSYFTEGETTNLQLNALKSLNIFNNKNLTFLDYACGEGKMIPILKNLNYNIKGYDKFVKNNNVLNNIDNLKFDVIYSNNFIEHLIDPINQIKDILTHLNDGGYLIFISDCIDEYKIEYTHFHSFYYVGNSFKNLCEKLNLNIIEDKYISPCKIKVLQRKS